MTFTAGDEGSNLVIMQTKQTLMQSAPDWTQMFMTRERAILPARNNTHEQSG